MNCPVPLPTRFEKPSAKFIRQVKRLPTRIQNQLGDVFDEFATGQLKAGRQPKQLTTGTTETNLYSVRLGKNYRFVYELIDDAPEEDPVGAPIAVGHRSSVYKKI